MNHPVRSGRAARRGLVGVAGRLTLAACLMATAACSKDPAAQKQEYLKSGQEYVAAGKLREAVIEFRNALQIDPRFAEAQLQAAEAYAKLGDGANALNAYVRAADLLPDNLGVQLTAGNYLLAAGRTEAALSRAETVLAREPANVEALVLRGNALGGLNDLDKAVASMEEAVRIDPSRGATYAQLGLVELARGRRDQAEAAFRRAIELAPTWVGGHLALANYFWSVGDAVQTERAFSEALRLEPANVAANRAMAAFLLAARRPNEAEPYLKKVVETTKQAPAAIFALSDYYVATGRPQQAVALLQPLASDDRRVAGANERLAAAYAVGNERPKAHALLDQVLARDKTNARAHLLKGQLLLQDGRSDEALTSVQRATAEEPTMAEAQYALGKVYAARGDMSGAEQAFREVLRLNPTAAAAQVELSRLQLSTSPREALATSEAAVKNQPNSFDARVALVRTLLASRDFARAEAELAILLREAPDRSEVHVQNGVLAGARGQMAAARAAFDKAQSLDPASIEAFAGHLSLDLNAKDFAGVRQRLSTRLNSSPVPPELLLLAGRTYASIGDVAEAEKVLRRSIETAPSLLPAYSMLGQLYLGQKRLDEARREFDTLSERQSRPVGPLTMSGVILQGQGDTAGARQRYERALALDPRASVAANNLAWIYAEAGENLPEAVRLAEAARQALPDSAEVLDTLGWAYYRSNLPALAVPVLTQAADKSPKNASYHYHLGLAHQKVGDIARARGALTRALEINPNFPAAGDARRALAALAESESR